MADPAIRAALEAADNTVAAHFGPGDAKDRMVLGLAIAAFLRALPPGGIWFNGGSITAPSFLATAVEEAARDAR